MEWKHDLREHWKQYGSDRSGTPKEFSMGGAGNGILKTTPGFQRKGAAGASKQQQPNHSATGSGRMSTV